MIIYKLKKLQSIQVQCAVLRCAKRLLTRNNATYNEINIATVDGAMDEMIKKQMVKNNTQIFFDDNTSVVMMRSEL